MNTMKRSRMKAVNPFDYYTRSKIIRTIKKYPYNIGDRDHLVTVSFLQIDVYNHVLSQCPDAIIEKAIDLDFGEIHVDICIPSKSLIIEVDGKTWHDDRASEDYLRDSALNDEGYEVFRVKERVWTRLVNKQRFIQCIINNQIATLEQSKDYLNMELEEVYEMDIINEGDDVNHDVNISK
jgi:uncharacterized protein DUF559